jgi:diacylglycerol kinase family enzyme
MPAFENEGISVLINKKSGNTNGAEILSAAFRENGVDAKIRAVHPRDFSTALGEIVRSRPKALYIGGGDGSIRSAASRLYKTDIALGVLPLGTLNHFSKDLGIPAEITEAIAALNSGTVQTIDIGSVNGQIFINNASLGFYPETVRRRESYQRNMGLAKYSAMAAALARTLWYFPVHDFHIHCRQLSERVRTPVLFVGNNRYRPEFMSIVQRDALSEGHLSLWYTNRASRIELIATALAVTLGGSRQAPGLEMLLTREVSVESPKASMRVALDGEVITIRPPLHFHILPKALKVIAPGKAQ